jgi:Smg protein
MKQTVMDVLMYLFDSYVDDDADVDTNSDSVRIGLLEAGFEERQVARALEWLDGLASLREHAPGLEFASHVALRVFNAEEMEKLDAECRGFLLFLEQAQVLSPVERELVMDRVMALQLDEVELHQLKWIVLMVLLNLPGRESSVAWMEDLVMDDMHAVLH